MNTVQIIAAQSQNRVIGKNNDIPWKVRGEQKLFKEITRGATLIMGRTTFESIGRPLPGRTTVIITRTPEYQKEGCLIARSLEMALGQASDLGKPIFIAGGGEIYKQSIPLADIVHLTTISAEIGGDVYFPEFPTEEFELVESRSFKSNINYIYQRFHRTKKNRQNFPKGSPSRYTAQLKAVDAGVDGGEFCYRKRSLFWWNMEAAIPLSGKYAAISTSSSRSRRY